MRGVNDVGTAEKLAFPLAIYFVAFFGFVIALSIHAGGEFLRSGWSHAHRRELALLSAPTPLIGMYCWLLSWRLLDRDDHDERARKRWFVLLILFSAVAGVVYILNREARRRRSRTPSPGSG